MQISILKEYAFHHMTMTRDFVWFRTLQIYWVCLYTMYIWAIRQVMYVLDIRGGSMYFLMEPSLNTESFLVGD